MATQCIQTALSIPKSNLAKKRNGRFFHSMFGDNGKDYIGNTFLTEEECRILSLFLDLQVCLCNKLRITSHKLRRYDSLIKQM